VIFLIQSSEQTRKVSLTGEEKYSHIIDCGYDGMTKADCLEAGCDFNKDAATCTTVASDISGQLSCDIHESERIYLEVADHPTSCKERDCCEDPEKEGCYFPTSSLGEQSTNFPHFGPLPTFSIIITCHENDAQFIAGALMSVVNQAYNAWECIIVDDGSKGRECFLAANLFIDKYRLRDRVSNYYKTNGWIADARNYGIEHASGKFILPLDADDYLSPNFLHYAAKALVTDENTELLYADQFFFGKHAKGPRWHLWEHLTVDNAINRGPLPVTTIYTRDLWQKAGGYKRDMIFGNEDYSFWISVLKLHPRAKKLPGISSWYRLKNNAMHSGEDYVTMGLPMLRSHHPELYSYKQISADLGTIFCYLRKAHESSLQDAVRSQPDSCPGWIYLSLLRLGLGHSKQEVLDYLHNGANVCSHAYPRKYFLVVLSWLEKAGHNHESSKIVDSYRQCSQNPSDCVDCVRLFTESMFGMKMDK